MWKYTLQVVLIWNAYVRIITQEDNPHDGKTLKHKIFPIGWFDMRDVKYRGKVQNLQNGQLSCFELKFFNRD